MSERGVLAGQILGMLVDAEGWVDVISIANKLGVTTADVRRALPMLQKTPGIKLETWNRTGGQGLKLVVTDTRVKEMEPWVSRSRLSSDG